MKYINFFFYDYETFGINVGLDKPAQFAYLITNFKFKFFKKIKNIYCFPPLDYFPNPEAVLTNNITPQKTIKYGFNEYNFAKKIYNIMKTSNTCFIGFNNISFDDEITRNLFYRNLFDPYAWSNANNNTRWDLLNISRAYYVLSYENIIWPKDKYQLPIFKLQKLTEVNHITHEDAHNAISDVYATMLLTKFFYKKNKILFKYLFKYRKKKNLFKLIDFKNIKPFLYISSIFSNYYSNIGIIYPIAWHPANKNILIAVDLMQDVRYLFSIKLFH
ncbi:exodeoxyribonuclease I [Buchnera aphidicola (Mollitrichosiphum nigrofasciatum)]|uniref:exodeoxyribonuclease I n=1 Tax=Buchnera aphidicola TaxID=9 RepID=UPI0031B85118